MASKAPKLSVAALGNQVPLTIDKCTNASETVSLVCVKRVLSL